MALSDKTQFDDRIAATFSTIPSKYPPLPNDVLKRFPSLESWQTEQSRLIARVREALDSMGSDFGIPLNKAQATQELLSKTVATQYDELSARITSETTILVDENQALAQRTTTIESTINTPTTGLLARINTVETTYATKDFALAKKEEAITAAVTSANGYTAGQITSLSSVYATPTFVETKKSEAITAAVTSANSSTDGKISALSSVYATPLFVETKKTEAIAAAVTSANSSTDGKISALSSVYATPTFVETKKSEAISAAATAATGYTDGQISSLSSVYATPLQVTSTVNNLISASVGSTSGTIGAAIETERLARANADGNLSGKFSLKVTAGNVVTGMNITSSTGAGTDVSSVTFLASEFKIFNSTTGIAPFAVVDGVVIAQNMLISGTLLVSGSIAASRLNFVPVSSTNVVASINATAEGIQISGSRIQINGSTTFSSGYDPSTKLTPGSAAADINANTTTISGGKITARSISASQIQAGTITANEIFAGTITAAQLNFTPVTSTNVIASINATIEGGLRITGSKIEISGSTTFSSGYDPSTKLTPGSAAADINANTTTINGGKITANSITASQIDVSTLSLSSSQIGGTAVTLSAIGSGLNITSGGVILSGTSAIRSSNYVTGSAGWAIKADGSVEFSSGTFRGSLSGATGTFAGALDVGTGRERKRIEPSGLYVGDLVAFNNVGLDTVLYFTSYITASRTMYFRSGGYTPEIRIGDSLYTVFENLGFSASHDGAFARSMTVGLSGLTVRGGGLNVQNGGVNQATISAAGDATFLGAVTTTNNTYSGSFSSNGNATFGSLTNTPFSNAAIDAFTNTTFYFHPNGNNSVSGGEDGGTVGATTGTYIAIRYNGRTVWVPFFTALP